MLKVHGLLNVVPLAKSALATIKGIKGLVEKRHAKGLLSSLQKLGESRESVDEAIEEEIEENTYS